MDTQSVYPTDPRHNHGEVEDDHHHEKNSVLKKVKAKAKKIKDTIKKHGPGHNHDHDHGHEYPEGHVPDDHDLDEEDDDEEELIQDPEVHGAPMYESTAAKTAVSGPPEDLSRPGITRERSKGLPTDPLASGERSENICTGNYETKHNDPPNRTDLGGLMREEQQQPRVNLGNTFEERPLAPQNTPMPPSHQVKDANPAKTFVHVEEEYTGQPKVNLQTPKGLEEDLAALKDTSNAYIPTNYETKVTDPTGEGEEAMGMSPILHSMDKMKIYDDDQDKGREENLPSATHPRGTELPFPTGTHDQFSPGPAPPLSTEPTPQENPQNVDKSLNQSSFTEKISSATSAIADKAVSAKNIVASKLGYGEKDETATTEPREGEGKGTTKSGMAATVTDKLSPVYEKLAGAGSAVESKLHGPRTGTATEVKTTEVQDQDKGVSVKSYITEKLKPGEEDKALSEVISEALHKPKEDHEMETKVRGKVTESEEVASRLGTFDEANERLGSGSVDSPTKSVVDMLRGTVGSWFGKSEGSQGTQQAHTSSSGNTGVSDSPSDRRLQESGN